MEDNRVRLQKALSQAGILSRRKAEEYIESGRIKVDGRKVALGVKINPTTQLVSLDGKNLNMSLAKKKIYIAIYKPRGYITTLEDEFDRKIITDLTKDIRERIFPVGRLDKDSEGLIFLTNDGDFANKLTHPKYGIDKTYRVTTTPNVETEKLVRLAEGLEIEGEMTRPAYVEVNLEDKTRTVLLVTIWEGRNRQVRKMFETLELEVKRLKRIEIGGVKLGILKPGKYRDLTKKEINHLIKVAETNYSKNS